MNKCARFIDKTIHFYPRNGARLIPSFAKWGLGVFLAERATLGGSFRAPAFVRRVSSLVAIATAAERQTLDATRHHAVSECPARSVASEPDAHRFSGKRGA